MWGIFIRKCELSKFKCFVGYVNVEKRSLNDIFLYLCQRLKQFDDFLKA